MRAINLPERFDILRKYLCVSSKTPLAPWNEIEKFEGLDFYEIDKNNQAWAIRCQVAYRADLIDCFDLMDRNGY